LYPYSAVIDGMEVLKAFDCLLCWIQYFLFVDVTGTSSCSYMTTVEKVSVLHHM